MAERVQQLGVGPEPIPYKRLTSERLAEAVRRAVNDPAMRERVSLIGRQIRAEDGVGQAVEMITSYLV